MFFRYETLCCWHCNLLLLYGVYAIFMFPTSSTSSSNIIKLHALIKKFNLTFWIKYNKNKNDYYSLIPLRHVYNKINRLYLEIIISLLFFAFVSVILYFKYVNIRNRNLNLFQEKGINLVYQNISSILI